MKNIFLASLDGGYESTVRSALEWLGLTDTIRPETRIAIKPNLTYPEYRRGVMTNPAALAAVLSVLRPYTRHLTVVESDSGGYNRFSMSTVFEKTGIAELARAYDAKVVNMSDTKSSAHARRVRSRTLVFSLPDILTKETDIFITMPVPKIHMNTGISIAIKNQWGVLSSPEERLRLHPHFRHIVYAVNKAMPKTVAIVDGAFGLTRSGPMEGDVVKLNWLLVADDPFMCDYVCSGLIGIDPMRISYLRWICGQEGISGLHNVRINTQLDTFNVDRPFFLRRRWTDYPGLLAFRYSAIAYLAYRSPLAGFLHKILYLFRKPFYDYEANRWAGKKEN